MDKNAYLWQTLCVKENRKRFSFLKIISGPFNTICTTLVMCSILHTSSHISIMFLTSNKISLLYLVLGWLGTAALLNLIKTGICGVLGNPQCQFSSSWFERAAAPSQPPRAVVYIPASFSPIKQAIKNKYNCFGVPEARDKNKLAFINSLFAMVKTKKQP